MERRLYKIKAQVILDVEYEVYAESKNEAISRFHASDIRDTLEESKIKDYDIEELEAELVRPIFVVKTSSIDYDIDYHDVLTRVKDKYPDVLEDSDEFDDLIDLEIEEFKKELPQELTLEIECERDDLDDCVIDAITDETDWLVNDCIYTVIDEK